MQIATTITDPLAKAFGLVSAEITIALTNARINGKPTQDLERRAAQVQASWATFIDQKHY